MRPPQRRDPSIIDSAPPEFGDEGPDGDVYLRIAGDYAAKLEAAEAELEQLKARRTVDEVRAAMLEGYSNRVFWFVAIYCGSVAALVLLAGFREWTGFALSDTILAIVAGSTAVSVIGLIGMVITGLFGGSARIAKASAKKATRDRA